MALFALLVTICNLFVLNFLFYAVLILVFHVCFYHVAVVFSPF